MNHIPDIPHPLQRDGRSQSQRVVKALAPPANRAAALENGSAMVEERTLADLLDFFMQYARQVRFESLKPRVNANRLSNGRSNGKSNLKTKEQETESLYTDWATLFRQSPLFILAGIHKTDTASIRAQFSQHADDAGRFDAFEGIHLMLEGAVSVLFQIHRWAIALGEADELSDLTLYENGIHSETEKPEDKKLAKPQYFGAFIRDIIKVNLQTPAGKLIGFALAAKTFPDGHFEELKDIEQWGFSKGLPSADPTFLKTPGSQRNKIRIAKQQLIAVFEELISGMEGIVSQAAKGLEDTVASNASHPPHIGLMLAFLRLFEKTNNNPADTTNSNLNAATQKHLDFFYQKVLGLKTKPAVPDSTHLVFELAKQLTDAKLDKAIAFLGGKDQNGIPIVFQLDEEIIVTKAQVSELRTLFLKKQKPYRPLAKAEDAPCQEVKTKGCEDPQEAPDTPKPSLTHDIVQAVFYAPVANSSNGKGDAFPKDSLEAWKTLGWEQSKLPKVGEEDLLQKHFEAYPIPRLAFALAAKALHLQGGKREIILKWSSNLPEGYDDVAIDFNNNLEAIQTALNTAFEVTDATIAAMSEAMGADNIAVKYLKNLPDTGRKNTLEAFLDGMKAALEAPLAPVILSDCEFKPYAQAFKATIQRHHGFDLSLSGEKEWLFPADVTITSQPSADQTALHVTMTIVLEADFPAVTWFNPEISTEKLDTHLPMMRLALRQSQQANGISLYHFFRYFQFSAPLLEVSVRHFKNLLVQTDEGVQDPNKPFLPFGALPKIGSNCYLGSEEIFRKKWKNLAVHIGWKDKPSNFEEHYANYQKGGIQESLFEVKIEALKQASWKDLGTKGLFSNDPMISTCPNNADSAWLVNNVPPFVLDENAAPLEPFSQFSKEGFLRFGLSGQTFQHNVFPQMYARQVNAQAMLADDKPVGGAIYKVGGGYKVFEPSDTSFIPTRITSSVELPLEPYSPAIESISVDYTADAAAEDLTFFHLHPFEGTFEKRALLPAPSVLPTFEDEGALLLGISDLTPGEQLDLLFQVAESTADPDLPPADVKWFYLTKNRWKELPKDTNLLSDATEGFLRSGVVKIAVPPDIDQENTILPAHLHWLKACAYQRAGAVSETIGVHAQAARATFVHVAGSFTDRLTVPLKADTVVKPLAENANIKKISQPYATFGGQTKEPMPRFYRRASEHLRHKGRAITLFDYERLVLEAFPEVYKVKCIPHTLGLPEELSDFHAAPGHVVVAVIPDLTKLELSERMRPKATRSLLDKIEDFLRSCTSPFVKIRALNARYQPFRVSGKVRFRQGKSDEFYRKQLQRDLDRILAPWAFEQGKEIDFGGAVHQSVILRHIEDLDYVDYVTDFLLWRKKDTTRQAQQDRGLTAEPEKLLRIAGIPISASELDTHLAKKSANRVKEADVLLSDYEHANFIPAGTARSILVPEEHVFEVLTEDCLPKCEREAADHCRTGLGNLGIGTGKWEIEKGDLPEEPDCPEVVGEDDP
jgi:hypothetical protein